MSEGKPSRRYMRIQWFFLLFAMISAIVAFTGLNAQDIATLASRQFFPTVDYILVESYDAPTTIPINFTQSLITSPQYFVVTSVSLQSDTIYQGEKLQFHLSLENKGKKELEQPRIRVYFVDSLQRVWGMWNTSAMEETLEEGCNIAYSFPTLDQKVIGTWRLFTVVYDDDTNELASYVMSEFTVTDIPPTPWWRDLSVIAAVVMTSIVTIVTATAFIKSLKDENKEESEKHPDD